MARRPPPRGGGGGAGARPAPPRGGGGGGGRPAPRGPTLGQATGGRPGRVAPPTAPKLGLGLNLGPKQRGAFQANPSQYLANHPGLQQRINRVNPTSQRATNIGNFMGTGQPQGRRALPQPPTMQPMPPGAGGLQPGPQFNPSMGQIGGNMYGQQPPFTGDFSQGTGDQLTPAGMQQLGIGDQMGGWGQRPASAGGIGGNPNMTTGTMYPGEMGGGGGGWQTGGWANNPNSPPGGQGGGGYPRPDYGVSPGMQSVLHSRMGQGGFGGYGGGLVQGGVYNRPGQPNPYQFGGGGQSSFGGGANYGMGNFGGGGQFGAAPVRSGAGAQQYGYGGGFGLNRAGGGQKTGFQSPTQWSPNMLGGARPNPNQGGGYLSGFGSQLAQAGGNPNPNQRGGFQGNPQMPGSSLILQ